MTPEAKIAVLQRRVDTLVRRINELEIAERTQVISRNVIAALVGVLLLALWLFG